MAKVSDIPTLLTLFHSFLRQRQIPPRLADELGLRPLDKDNASEMIGFNLPNPVVLIPYDGPHSYYRLRMLGDIPDGWSRYLCPKGSGSAPLYCPPVNGYDWEDIKVDPHRGIVITEGEFKAIVGSLSGPPTLGLGGVQMQRHLFDTGWEWKGRNVQICFDHDKGQMPGEYKPQVANALGKLASMLIREGAVVKVLHVGRAGMCEVSEKLGLDDYLLRSAEGADRVEAWKVLLLTGSAPPEWSADLAALLEDNVYVIGTNHTHVYGLTHGYRKSPEDLDKAHIEKRRVSATAEGKTKVEQLTKIWATHANRLTAIGYTLNPRLPFGFVEENGRPVINLWRGFPDWPACPPDKAQQVAADWERFVDGLFGKHRQWVTNWTAHMLAKPWERTTQAIMLTTDVQGIGKSLYGAFLRALVGEHGVELKAGRMFDKFNGVQEGRVFLQVDELDVKFSKKEGDLNDAISEEVQLIEPKNKDPIELPNLKRYYLTTNSNSPCRLSVGQRRVMVIHPPRYACDTRGEWGQWVSDVVAAYLEDEEALGAICNWFIGQFDESWKPKAPVPQTEEGLELERSSGTAVQRVARDLLEWAIGTPDPDNPGQLVGGEWQDGWFAAHPTTRKAFHAVFTELSSIVKSSSAKAYAGEKVIKESGKALHYSVFDVLGDQPRKTTTKGTTFVVDPQAARDRSVAVETEIRRLWNLAAKHGEE